ncbi:MAG: hypothetical protein KAS30_00900, partial [Candidatus Diapherotrites archaeon]|nr:hypothetical protein [Candidatus Diapherotrites archaeon]
MKPEKKQNLIILIAVAVFILIMFIAFLVFSPQTSGKLRAPQQQDNQAELSCNFTDDNIICTSEKCVHEINYVVENTGSNANLEHVSIRVIAGSQEKKFNLKNISSGEKVNGQVTIESDLNVGYLFYDLSALNARIVNCDGFIKRTVCPDSCGEKGDCYSGTCSEQTDYVCNYEPKENCCGNDVCEVGESFATCENDGEPPECNECETLIEGLCVADFEKCPKIEPRELSDLEIELVGYANEIGLNVEKFQSCMQFDEKKEVVEQQIYEGFERYWINHTPTYILAGNVKIVGS